MSQTKKQYQTARDQNGSSVQDSALNMMEDYQVSAEEYVREKPVSMTMLALGAGAAVGLLLSSALVRREEEKRHSYMSRLRGQVADSWSSAIPESLGWKR